MRFESGRVRDKYFHFPFESLHAFENDEHELALMALFDVNRKRYPVRPFQEKYTVSFSGVKGWRDNYRGEGGRGKGRGAAVSVGVP